MGWNVLLRQSVLYIPIYHSLYSQWNSTFIQSIAIIAFATRKPDKRTIRASSSYVKRILLTENGWNCQHIVWTIWNRVIFPSSFALENVTKIDFKLCHITLGLKMEEEEVNVDICDSGRKIMWFQYPFSSLGSFLPSLFSFPSVKVMLMSSAFT